MPKQFPTEFRDCAVRMTMDRLSEYPSVHAACKALAPKLGVGPESLRRWVVQAQVDAGEKSGPSSEELEEIKRRYPKTPPTGGMIPGTVHSPPPQHVRERLGLGCQK